MTAEHVYRRIPRFGWHPSLPDQRDFLADASEIKIKDKVDPRKKMTPIYNQGNLGSCTANAVAAVFDYHLIVLGASPFLPSRLALYSLERIIAGFPLSEDTGAYGRDGFKAAQKYGLLPERLYPYNVATFADDPRDELKKYASQVCKLTSPYKAVRRSVVEFKRVLSNKQTVAFGFTVYESFESLDVERKGIVPMPDETEATLGGHEVVAVGYLKSKPNHVLCRNSWGEDWGLGGYFFMPWSYLLDPNLSGDFRTIYHPLS